MAIGSEEARLAELAGQLQRQTRLFDTVLSSIADFAYTFDRAGRFIYANRPLCELLGRTLEEVAGRDFHELGYAPELATKLQAQVEHVFITGEKVVDETPFMSPTGAGGFYEYILQPVLNAAGETEVVAGSTRVITERKRMEGALRASEEQLRLIVENARDFAIVSMDPDRHITSWNLGAQGILGYTTEEALGQSADMIFTPEDQAVGIPVVEATTALATGRAADERWHMRKDGSRFWGSGVMMAMRDGGRGAPIGLVKIFRDQTAAREAQEAIEKSRQQLLEALKDNERVRAEVEAAGRAKDHFLAILSHELRTPLTPALMICEMLLEEEGLSLLVRDGLETILRNVKLEAHFIDDLLDVTRITHGKLELAHEPLDLHDAIRGAVEISRPDIQAKHQTLTIKLGAVRSRVRGDMPRLQQLFWNLLKNAAKFTPERGSLRIATRLEPGHIVAEISDTGCGISPSALPDIFDPFRQADVLITREFGGLGLGLAISKATVKAHGGTIAAESPGRGEGTTFTIRIPLLGDSPESPA